MTELTPEDHVIVVFGANGDLASRKLLPALYHLDREGLMPKQYRIIGNSRSEMTDDEFRAFARDAVQRHGRAPVDDGGWEPFAEKMAYVGHEFDPDDAEPVAQAVAKAESAIGGEPRRLFYLAVPPPAFPVITEAIGKCGLQPRARVVYEKPYGWDMPSFEELNRRVHAVLDEEQVFRIDHFLGKEAVQNILALRFANGMFEPVWNRNHIDHVQIDVPETLSIGTRAGFYEKVGALRDMVVTHLFQVLTFVAMEPPTSFSAKSLNDEKEKVFETMVPLEPSDIVRGQYEGYRQTEGVAADSTTETFVAARVCIDNWRWAGVPFFLRTGKCLAQDRTAITLAFKPPPRQMFPEMPSTWSGRDHMVLNLGPHEGITLSFFAKVPGPDIELAKAKMTFTYEGSFGSELIEAYERLIHDALLGDRTLFTRGDGIGRVWELVSKVLADPPPVHVYEPGSWGPKEADELIAPRSWHGE